MPDRGSIRWLAIAGAACVLTSCTRSGPSALGPPPEPPRTTLIIAHDPGLAEAATGLEHGYEADQPDVDVLVLSTADRPRADVLLLDEPDDRPALDARIIERHVAIVVPADSALRLIDLSRGDCDVVIGRDGTALGELGRATLRARGLDDQINPRLIEADRDDVIARVVERQAIGLAYAAHAADHAAEVRIVAEGQGDLAMIAAMSPEGVRFLEWLEGGFTNRRPLRAQGFELTDPGLRLTPQDPP